MKIHSVQSQEERTKQMLASKDNVISYQWPSYMIQSQYCKVVDRDGSIKLRGQSTDPTHRKESYRPTIS